MKPLCIDLYCGLGGWAEGFLAEGYQVMGFDLERWAYPGELVLQDVLTLGGAQFRNAAVIVASPPCQEFSFAAMPWKLAKAQKPQILPAWWNKPEPKMSDVEMAAWKAWKAEHPATPPNTDPFDACYRIQREASEAAGHHIPLVVENVKGAQPWVGRAKGHYGSFYLWGDVENIGGRIVASGPLTFGAASVRAARAQKFNPDGTAHPQGSWFKVADSKNRGARKNSGGSWFAVAHNTKSGHSQNPVSGEGIKQHGSGAAWFDKALDQRRREGVKMQSVGSGPEYGGDFGWDGSTMRMGNSKSDSRKAASALIAKIPFPLAQHIARMYQPVKEGI